jgi:phenylacetate-CoA ligase
MFVTGIRQIRAALSTVLGRPFRVGVLERLVKDALATWDEFGAPGDDVGDLLDGPYSDRDLAADLQTRALRRTARRLAQRSTFYRGRFDKSDVDARRLTLDTLRAIPVTTRADLIEHAEDFLCSRPYLSSRTTGTTGRPAEIWISGHEYRLWPALSALSIVLRGELRPDDRVQVSVSSRATGAVQMGVSVCRLVDVPCRMVGLVSPAEAVDHLAGVFGPPPTLLQTYPSYLGALVTEARTRGLGPDDFALRVVNLGGELLSDGLAAAARETLGAAHVVDTYAATELFPAGGRVCAQRHLHLDPNMAYVEVIDLAGDAPAEPGELGTLVVTPYYPYRECMPVFRYDTRDLVRRLPEKRPTCELAAVPAVSRVLGKATGLLPTDAGPVTSRDIVEVLEALPGAPWPARFEATAADGRIRLTLPASHTGGLTASEITDHFAAAGIESTVDIVALTAEEGVALRRLRCDLVERTFTRSGP